MIDKFLMASGIASLLLVVLITTGIVKNDNPTKNFYADAEETPPYHTPHVPLYLDENYTSVCHKKLICHPPDSNLPLDMTRWICECSD